MNPQWHVAFCNVTYVEYARMSYRDYYASPANMLEAQLRTRALAEEKFGIGCFVVPAVDTPAATLASYLGMPIVETEADELPYVDVAAPLLRQADDADGIALGDPRTTGLMARRWEAWQYYRAHGHKVRLGGHGGGIVTTAHEISGGGILHWLVDEPEAAGRVLDLVTRADLSLRAFDESLCGPTDSAYTGDDFSGLLSPEMYRQFAIPYYARFYAGRSDRFMHSELLRADHLRIARDLLGITCFHGAGCKNLTLAELHAIMGAGFWTQVTPQELAELSPRELSELIKRYADSGCGYVQLYPGRGTPDVNMRCAIETLDRVCSGGRLGKYL